MNAVLSDNTSDTEQFPSGTTPRSLVPLLTATYAQHYLQSSTFIRSSEHLHLRFLTNQLKVNTDRITSLIVVIKNLLTHTFRKYT